MKKSILLFAMIATATFAYGQTEKKEQRVRIVTIENGQKKVIEKVISDGKDISEDIKIMEDTLVGKGKRRMVTVEVDAKDRMPGMNWDAMPEGHKRMPMMKAMMDQASSTIKALHIQENQPFNGKFNVHFNAPEKGTVSISVTDIQGKELATEQIKDFQGEYLGQIDIKKSTKGVYFVRVVQGNDGAVRRVKVD